MAAGVLEPRVIDRWGHGCGHGAGADVPNNVEGLLQCVVHAQHLVAPLSLLGRFFHQCVLVPARVQVGQQLREDKLLGLCTEKEGRKLEPEDPATLSQARPAGSGYRTGSWGLVFQMATSA